MLVERTSKEESQASRDTDNDRGYHLLSICGIPGYRVHEGRGCICFAHSRILYDRLTHGRYSVNIC